MSIRIYTKTGDQGTTGLIGGTRVPKSDLRINAYGTIDELNAFIGFLNDQVNPGIESGNLREIQDRLFTIGASLACDPQKEPKMKIPDLKESDLEMLEKAIDRMEEQLPPMKSFLIPGGHLSISSAHIARTICRRSERLCVEMLQNDLFMEPLVIKYLNRLSDYLFVLARFLGKELGVPDIPWKPRTGAKD
jgi:cob(I)alamin adenosyltransferase